MRARPGSDPGLTQLLGSLATAVSLAMAAVVVGLLRNAPRQAGSPA
jgi:hypothetical protein